MPVGKTGHGGPIGYQISESEIEIIMSEAMDWFSRWVDRYLDREAKAIIADPPNLLDAFKAGWCAHRYFDVPPSEKSEIEELRDKIVELKSTNFRLNEENIKIHQSNSKIGLLIEILRIPDLDIDALTEFVKKQQP